jgi:predicted nucleotidyltransferase
MELNPKLLAAVKRQEYPMVFVTVSGAHLYGFPSPDSDYDLRGVHVLPIRDVLGLDIGTETIEVSEDRDGVQLDLVTHDINKFFRLLLKKNGYVLEQLYSPLIVYTTPEHVELKEIAQGCITRHHSHHYLGFAETEWKLLNKENTKKIKSQRWSLARNVLQTG